MQGIFASEYADAREDNAESLSASLRSAAGDDAEKSIYSFLFPILLCRTLTAHTVLHSFSEKVQTAARRAEDDSRYCEACVQLLLVLKETIPLVRHWI